MMLNLLNTFLILLEYHKVTDIFHISRPLPLTYLKILAFKKVLPRQTSKYTLIISCEIEHNKLVLPKLFFYHIL